MYRLFYCLKITDERRPRHPALAEEHALADFTLLSPAGIRERSHWAATAGIPVEILTCATRVERNREIADLAAWLLEPNVQIDDAPLKRAGDTARQAGQEMHAPTRSGCLDSCPNPADADHR